MKFNPLTNTLYTDDDRLIKQMYCPYVDLQWNDLSHVENSMDRFCAICESNVLETKKMGEDELYELLQREPGTCLKIDLNQDNIRIDKYV